MIFRIRNDENGEIYDRPINMSGGLLELVGINSEAEFHFEEFCLTSTGAVLIVNLDGKLWYKTLPFKYSVIFDLPSWEDE